MVGDNLASHLSEYVISKCDENNIRFCLLPENSTHFLQPLDVAVFSPLKAEWKRLLREWKEECVRKGKAYATIPKEVFPKLLKKLLEKDFSNSIRSGFATCGIYPISLEKALADLPQEETEAATNVQKAMLARLNKIRFGKPAQASRPKKSEKLPAGASYTCAGGGDAGDHDSTGSSSSSSETSDNDSDNDSSSEEDRVRSDKIRQMAIKLCEKAKKTKKTGQQQAQKQQQQLLEEDNGEDYPVGCFVTAVYEGDWYYGQVVDKRMEPEAEPDNDYLFITFMERDRIGEDSMRWPTRADMLNIPLSDVLFGCNPPLLKSCTSSSRSASYEMSKEDIKTTKRLFKSKLSSKENYPIKLILLFLLDFSSNLVYFLLELTTGTGTGILGLKFYLDLNQNIKSFNFEKVPVTLKQRKKELMG